MKFTKTLIASSILAASSLTATVQAADASPITANIGVASNYVWRGVTQSADEAAVSGGIDYAHDSGFYAGGWWSNLAGNQYEQDLYAGYGFDAGPVSLDVGYIEYMYPLNNATDDFSEIYVNASYEMITAGVAYTTDQEDNGNSGSENDLYLYVSAEFEVKKGLTLGLTYGDYDIDGGSATDDYSHIQVSLSKDDFTLAYDDTDQEGTAGDARVSVSWSKSFDL